MHHQIMHKHYTDRGYLCIQIYGYATLCRSLVHRPSQNRVLAQDCTVKPGTEKMMIQTQFQMVEPETYGCHEDSKAPEFELSATGSCTSCYINQKLFMTVLKSPAAVFTWLFHISVQCHNSSSRARCNKVSSVTSTSATNALTQCPHAHDLCVPAEL